MAAFAKNTRTFFNQTAAPTGWTKITAEGDDYTLRVVSGSTGGTVSGSTGVTSAFVDTTWTGSITGVSGSMAAANADLPSHNHLFSYETIRSQGSIMIQYPAPGVGQKLVPNIGTRTSDAAGSSASHAHNIVMGSGTITGNPTGFAVKYVDFILASKV